MPAVVEECLRDGRTELFEFAGTLVGYDAQNPRARTAAVDHLRTEFRRREPTLDPSMTELSYPPVNGGVQRGLPFWPILRQVIRTHRSRSASRDLLTGAPRPFAWSEGPPVPRYSSARPRVCSPSEAQWHAKNLRFLEHASAVSLVATEIPQSDALDGHQTTSGDGVVLVAIFQTREIITVAVVRVREPTRRTPSTVLAGSTCSTVTPCSAALYSTYSQRRLNAHLCPRDVPVRSRISIKSSNAITEQSWVRASATSSY